MNRFFVVLSLAALSWAAVLLIVPLLTVDAWLLLAAATVALVALARPSPAPVRSFWQRLTARPSPAPVRSFWQRLTARTRDPVPSTT